MKLTWRVKLIVLAIVLVIIFLLFRKEKYNITSSTKSDLMEIMNKSEISLNDQEKLIELFGKWDLNAPPEEQEFEPSDSEKEFLLSMSKSYPSTIINIRNYFKANFPNIAQ
jgi:hypothetical protein